MRISAAAVVVLLVSWCLPGQAQFLPPDVRAEEPAAEALQPGVGFRLLPGATSCWQASPKPGRATGCAPFGACDPFPSSGVGNASDQESFVCRYLGGDRENFGARPGSGGAEGSFIYAGPALALAFKAQSALPGGGQWVAGNWDGVPTDRERTDFEFLAGSDGWIRATWQPVETIGTTPEHPLEVSAVSCDLWREERTYFVRAHPKTKRPYYWQQQACKVGEISYSVARKDPDYGVSLPAYPQIFGPPTLIKPGEPPPLEIRCGDGSCAPPESSASCPADCCPACPSFDAECPARLASVTQRAEVAEAARHEAEAELAALRSKPVPPVCPEPPARCVESLGKLLGSPHPLRIGPGWRSRIEQCRAYMQEVSTCLKAAAQARHPADRGLRDGHRGGLAG